MRFKGEFRFLSNFYPCKIIAWGMEFPTAEHVYVATKTEDMEMRKAIAKLVTPGNAKRFGRKMDVRADWGRIKVSVMRGILKRKFADERLINMLQSIKGQIVEDNNWHDNFWGACSCSDCATKEKKNTLGKLLMEVRDEQKLGRHDQ